MVDIVRIGASVPLVLDGALHTPGERLRRLQLLLPAWRRLDRSVEDHVRVPAVGTPDRTGQEGVGVTTETMNLVMILPRVMNRKWIPVVWRWTGRVWKEQSAVDDGLTIRDRSPRNRPTQTG